MKRNIIGFCFMFLLYVASFCIETGDLVAKAGPNTNTVTSMCDQTDDSNTKEIDSKRNINVLDAEKKVFYGKWVVSRVVAHGRVNAGEEVARKWLEGIVTFAECTVSVNGNILENPYYQEKKFSEADFFPLSGYVNFTKLGINTAFIDEVRVLDKEKNSQWATVWSRFYIKDRNTLLVYTDGVWFEAVRLNNN